MAEAVLCPYSSKALDISLARQAEGPTKRYPPKCRCSLLRIDHYSCSYVPNMTISQRFTSTTMLEIYLLSAVYWVCPEIGTYKSSPRTRLPRRISPLGSCRSSGLQAGDRSKTRRNGKESDYSLYGN